MAVYTEASRAATGMLDVLAIIIVLSINFFPVRGSSSSGNSANISTTSFARSPHAAIITISASACLEIACCKTVLPVPKGPGINPVPPSVIGLRVSIQRTPVSSNLKGRGFSLNPPTATLTGHFWTIVSLMSLLFSSVTTAICSSTVYSPSPAISFSLKVPFILNGTIIL